MVNPRLYTDEERIVRHRQQSKEYNRRNKEKQNASSALYYSIHKDTINKRKRDKRKESKITEELVKT